MPSSEVFSINNLYMPATSKMVTADLKTYEWIKAFAKLNNLSQKETTRFLVKYYVKNKKKEKNEKQRRD